MLNRKFSNFNSRTNHSRDVVRKSQTHKNKNMTSLKDMNFTEVKSIYDFLEIRKNIISNNPENFHKNEIHQIINCQKITWEELHNKFNNIKEFK